MFHFVRVRRAGRDFKSIAGPGRNGFPTAGNFPWSFGQKRGGLCTFLVHPGEPPNWSARTKENEKFLGPKRKLTDTYCEVSYFLSVLGQSMSVLGRIVADTYCEVSESMSVLGRIVADTYCEVSQGLLI